MFGEQNRKLILLVNSLMNSIQTPLLQYDFNQEEEYKVTEYIFVCCMVSECYA